MKFMNVDVWTLLFLNDDFYAYIWHLDFAQNLKKAKKTKEISLWGSKVKKVHVSGREVSQYWVVGMIDYQQ